METVIRQLAEGLVLRHARIEDSEALAAFNGEIHGRDNQIERRSIGVWTEDLISGRHPTFKSEDFLLVEDPKKKKIISSLNLISQVWTYAGIPFKVGRIELVGTAPEYRRRGLVRNLFEEIHKMSQERGELVQAITGIPYYYRQFGYEMALGLQGGRLGYASSVPELPAGKEEPYNIRPAVEKDLALISRLYDQAAENSLVSCQRTIEMWRYQLLGNSPDNIDRFELMIILDPSGKAVGCLAHPAMLWPNAVTLVSYCISPEVSWWEVTPGVMRYLRARGIEYGKRAGRECAGIYFCLGEEHPVYKIFGHRLPRIIPPYAYYLRLPDLAAFVRLIAPVLEKRLAEVIQPGYSGELRLSFYRSGLALRFDRGVLADCRNLPPADLNDVAAGFPGLTFLQILFGYHSLDQVRGAFPDCWVDEDKCRPLLEALFPRQASNVWPIS